MKRSAWLVACIAIGATIWVACEKEQTVALTPPTWRFECPDTKGVHIALVGTDHNGNDTVYTVLDDSIRLSGPIVDIPEYHDCQRFIQGNQYNALFAIFAAFRLDTVHSRTPGVSQPIATIYTPDGSYPQLGIGTGFNCLFLTSAAGGQWKAEMIPWGVKDANCTDGHLALGSGTTLEVKVEGVSRRFAPNEVPPVARWDRDKTDSVYTIGIRCGDAWCSVGKPGFAPSSGYPGPALSFDPIDGRTPTLHEQQRVQAIKGWYDVQRLAVPLQSGAVSPTTFRGFLIPHPFLDSLAWFKWKTSATEVLKAYHALGWIHVGYAFMEGDYEKWGFRKGKNKIYMCYGTLGDKCTFPDPLPTGEHPTQWPSLTACPADPTITASRWWAKTVPETGPATYVCIQRMDHRVALMQWLDAHPGVSFSIPGTARWRFLPVDESSWFGCPTGCCTKQ